MRRFFRCFAILFLCSASVAATAQDAGSAISKQDLPDPRSSIDQNPVSTGDVSFASPGAMAGKTRITNANTAATDSGTGGKPALGKDVQQLQTVAGTTRREQIESEFQKFVQESTGKLLPIYGAEMFSNAPSTFAPILNSPVPPEYPLGPGDEILIRGWGTIDIDYRATVDRNGLIAIPTIGSVSLAGVTADKVESVIQGAVGKLYKGVNLSVTFGHLRAITVYVVGQASRPGTYTVSNLSTLVTALFASGGPNANGSMRRVQVKRGGKVVAELDLYAFIANGDKAADIKLQDGDTIYIPPASGFVAVVGSVNSPAIFELRTAANDTIEDLLGFEGGLSVVADPRRAFLERLDPTKNQPRTVEEFALDAKGIRRLLKNGDLLNITSITPEFSNAVVLRGNVDQAIRAPFRPGMRISDLIPSRAYLISRSSVHRHNDTLKTGENDRKSGDNAATLASGIGDLIDEINWDYAVVERINRNDLSVSLIPFNLGEIFDNPAGANNVVLQPGDTVTIFSQQDMSVPLDKRRIFVRIEGEVNVPGVYQMKQGDNLHMLIARSGGPTHNAYLFGTAFYREQVRKEQEANMAKAIDRLESRMQSEQAKAVANVSITADAQIAESQRQAALLAAKEAIARMRNLHPTGRIAFGLDPADRSFNKLPELKLENGDQLVIPFRPDFVHVFGSVNSESSQLWRPDMPVSKYLKSAGVTADADLDNAFIIRADGSVISSESSGWFSRNLDRVYVMAGDSIVVPEKLNKETSYTRFVMGLKDWTQIIANFGLGAAAIKVLQ